MLTEMFRSSMEYRQAVAYLNDTRRVFVGFAAKSCSRLTLLVYPCAQVVAALEQREVEKLSEALTIDGGFVKVSAVQAMAFRHAFGAPCMEIPTQYEKYSDLALDASKPGRAWELAAMQGSKQTGRVYDISGLKQSGGDMVIVMNDIKVKIELKGRRGRFGA